MGQSQSDTASIDETTKDTDDTPIAPLVAEAVADGVDEEKSIDEQAADAVECLPMGPCRSQFTEAFLCFLKSSTEDKGSDCVNPFMALQNCIRANPDAFAKDIDEDDQASEKKGSSPAQRLIPPTWSVEAPNPKPKL